MIRGALLAIAIVCGVARVVGTVLAMPGLFVVGLFDELGFWAEQRRRGIR